MDINLKQIAIREIVKGYKDNNEEGIVGFDGKLNIRPPYQRMFVYKDKQRDAVINTINAGFPLNAMYWCKNEDGTYEVLDGQQRTISFCQYVDGVYSINTMYFHNLTDEEQNKILDYKCMVFVIENGTDRERLEWFKTINIAGEKLTDQELLNANYTGAWLADAKRLFSKRNCWATRLASDYVKGSDIRQEILEIALKWISNGNPQEYMARHQHDKNANELKLYFASVIDWVKTIFGEKNYRKEMKGLNWGDLYNRYHTNSYDSAEIEVRVNELMANDEVTNKKGVYEYILSGEDEDMACKLSKRIFSDADKRTAYERQGGVCPITGLKLSIEEMQADHIKPWWKGGTTTLDNLQMISKTANKRKGGRDCKDVESD